MNYSNLIEFRHKVFAVYKEDDGMEEKVRI